MSSVIIGCCGFRSSRTAYFRQLPAVEVQHTFYQPPRVETLARWRAEAPEGFVFTVKAWQLITHAGGSPTYRRMTRALTDEERTQAGSFRDTPVVAEGWAATRASAAALGATAILFQCPASFQPSQANVEHMMAFFSHAERDGRHFCWEPRGDWPPDLVRDLCETLDLWHVVDPFAQQTETPDRCYFRLHGRTGWRYRYEDGELEELAGMLPEDAPSYVFFNNVHMLEDAVRFRGIVEG
ncbi:MAG TPA: DUF72 domain-containing protein [Rhodothermales bacterium]|nr:DUF72 domain-containing protein [Rhodothermales bacterium]